MPLHRALLHRARLYLTSATRGILKRRFSSSLNSLWLRIGKANAVSSLRRRFFQRLSQVSSQQLGKSIFARYQLPRMKLQVIKRFRYYESHQAISDPRQLIWALIVINGGVFLLWNTYGSTSARGQQFMLNNFTVSYRNLVEGRVHTIITSCFSQSSLMHLLSNMVQCPLLPFSTDPWHIH